MFDKFHKKMMAHAIKVTGIDTKEEFEGKPRKFLYWMAYKFFPFMTNVGIYMVLFFMINEIKNSKGFETAIIVCFMIIIFEISGVSGRIAEMNGEYEENGYDKLKRLEEEAKRTESSTNQKTF